jgi:hypothetical protein
VNEVRSTIVLAVAVLTVAVAVVARTTTPAAAAPPVEDEGAGCSVSLPGSVPANSKLPDPFKRIDGTRITSKADWTCRREEIKRLAETYAYGTKPAKPATVTGTVSRTSITVNVTDQGRSSSFSASVSVPSGNGPFPAVFVVGGFGADTSTIQAAGVATINYDPLAVGKEGTARNNKQGAFYSIYGSTSSTGLLVAWAWGVSRLIDVIEQSGGSVFRSDALGVTGCSRYGKGAFAIGAFDQRIALTMPIESGSGGVPIWRGIPGESGSQPLSSAYSEQPWMGDAFGSYTGNPNGLPVDTHEVVGMIAPRGLFIMENPSIDWLAAQSGSVGALGGAEVYKALGSGSNISYWSDVADGTHCAVRPEWKAPLQQSLQAFLLKSGNPPGVFRVSSKKPGNLANWRDWTTPTLTGSGSTSPPPTSSSPSVSPSGSSPAGATIVGTGSSRCIDTGNGTRPQLYDCDNSANQVWTRTGSTFVNPQSGNCLTASGTANSSSVTLSTCNSASSQQWTVAGNGTITNNASGRCLDAIGQATANGTQLQIYDCVSTGQANQQWTLR